MFRKHNYRTEAFLPSDGELLYCALFETYTAHVNYTGSSHLLKCSARQR